MSRVRSLTRIYCVASIAGKVFGVLQLQVKNTSCNCLVCKQGKSNDHSIRGYALGFRAPQGKDAARAVLLNFRSCWHPLLSQGYPTEVSCQGSPSVWQTSTAEALHDHGVYSMGLGLWLGAWPSFVVSHKNIQLHL